MLVGKVNHVIGNKATMDTDILTKKEKNIHKFLPTKPLPKRITPLESSYFALLDYLLEQYTNRDTERRDRKTRKKGQDKWLFCQHFTNKVSAWHEIGRMSADRNVQSSSAQSTSHGIWGSPRKRNYVIPSYVCAHSRKSGKNEKQGWNLCNEQKMLERVTHGWCHQSEPLTDERPQWSRWDNDSYTWEGCERWQQSTSRGWEMQVGKTCLAFRADCDCPLTVVKAIYLSDMHKQQLPKKVSIGERDPV